MNAETLRGLSRPELQKLAKANGVKANLKSETIIALVVEKHVSVSKPDSTRQSKNKNTITPESPTPTRGLRKSAQVSHALGKGFDRSIEAKTPEPNLQGQTNSRRSVSLDTHTTFATPKSSPEHTPEPALPDSIDTALEIMAIISSGDAELLPQIQELHSLAKAARKQAEDLRAILRAERGLRERLEAYVCYWREIAPGWSHRELWADRMRVRFGEGNTWEELSSDEESEPEDTALPDGALATLKPGQQVPPEYLGAGMSTRSPGTTTNRDGPKPNKKRYREADDSHSAEDNSRYIARIRSEAVGAGGSTDISTSSPMHKPLDKGKRKMTPGEVERMTRTREDQWLHQSRPPAIDRELPLGLSEEDIEQDRVVALLSGVEHCDDTSTGSNTPQQLLTPEVEVVPARRVTRKSSRQPQTRRR